MSLLINIDNLLNKQRIESNRVEFKTGWNPVSIYHSICAFANDIDDLGGGYVIVGVDTDENGVANRPVVGIDESRIDGILQEMIGYNAKLAPYYMPRTSVEKVNGKKVLVIWCPSGVNRPYTVPENVTAKSITKEYCYVRCGSSSIIAKGEVLDELRDLSGRIPFDEKGNPEISLDDISLVLLRDHLVKIGSRLAQDVMRKPLEEILEQMNLFTGPSENRLLKNVAAMMFCEHPEKFFKYLQVDVVVFPEGKIKSPNNFREKTFTGSVPQIISQTMTFLKTEILFETVQKVSGQAEALRFWNYPYEALEEVVVNSLYHRDYRQYEPVEITIEPDCICVLNCPGPDRSISKEALEKGELLRSRRYRNRRLGDFLKELDLTEGRSTGVPTIQEKLRANGSPRAVFETDEDRLAFLVTIPVHEGCENRLSSGTCSETGSETPKRTIDKIMKIIKERPGITNAELANILDISPRAVGKHLKKLRDDNRIVRVGSPTYGGGWESLEE